MRFPVPLSHQPTSTTVPLAVAKTDVPVGAPKSVLRCMRPRCPVIGSMRGPKRLVTPGLANGMAQVSVVARRLRPLSDPLFRRVYRGADGYSATFHQIEGPGDAE